MRDILYYTFEDEKQKKQYTPKAFYNNFAGDFLNQFVNIISLPYEKLPFGETCVLTDVFQVVGGQEEQFLNLPLYERKGCQITGICYNKCVATFWQQKISKPL